MCQTAAFSLVYAEIGQRGIAGDFRNPIHRNAGVRVFLAEKEIREGEPVYMDA